MSKSVQLLFAYQKTTTTDTDIRDSVAPIRHEILADKISSHEKNNGNEPKEIELLKYQNSIFISAKFSIHSSVCFKTLILKQTQKLFKKPSGLAGSFKSLLDIISFV